MCEHKMVFPASSGKDQVIIFSRFDAAGVERSGRQGALLDCVVLRVHIPHAELKTVRAL